MDGYNQGLFYIGWNQDNTHVQSLTVLLIGDVWPVGIRIGKDWLQLITERNKVSRFNFNIPKTENDK